MNELLMSAEELRNHTRVMTLILEHARQGEAFTALGVDEKHLHQLKESAFALLSTQNIRFSLDTIGDFLLRSGEKIEFKLMEEIADALATNSFGSADALMKISDAELEDLNILNSSPILNPPMTTKPKVEEPDYIKPMSLEDRRKVGLVKDIQPGEKVDNRPPPIPALATASLRTEAQPTVTVETLGLAYGATPAQVAEINAKISAQPVTINPLDVFTADDDEEPAMDQWGTGLRKDPNIEIERTAKEIKITRKK